jgi:hypothetical protein
MNDQSFDAHHQQLRSDALSDPKRRSLTNHPRACWYRRTGSAGAPWELGIALAWDTQRDYTGVIIETAEGEVLSLPIGLIRFEAPDPMAAG